MYDEDVFDIMGTQSKTKISILIFEPSGSSIVKINRRNNEFD